MTHHPAIVGHRGWPARFPDNTLSGFLAAAGVADAVELDIRRSGDGKLVLSHDPDLAGRVVAETPWSELSQLDLGDGHHPALLDEVLAALGGTPIQLEVKNWPMQPGFEPDHRLALETAERTRPGDMVTGFNAATLAAVRRVFPGVPTGLCLLPGVALDEGVKQCLDAGHTAVVPHYTDVIEEIDTDLELDIYPYPVNDPIRAAELVEFGVKGIITDDPGLMSAALRS